MALRLSRNIYAFSGSDVHVPTFWRYERVSGFWIRTFMAILSNFAGIGIARRWLITEFAKLIIQRFDPGLNRVVTYPGYSPLRAAPSVSLRVSKVFARR